MKEELNSILQPAQKLLVEITDGDFADHEALANESMSYIFEIGCALELNHSSAETSSAQSFLENLRSRLSRLLLVLSMFVTRTEYMLASNWEDDEWRYVCERRSSIEFLRTLLSIPETEPLIDTR